MKRMFGCLPPWIPVSDNQGFCPLVKKDFYKAGPSDIPHNVFNLVDNQRILDFCKTPCLIMDIKLEKSCSSNRQSGAIWYRDFLANQYSGKSIYQNNFFVKSIYFKGPSKKSLKKILKSYE